MYLRVVSLVFLALMLATLAGCASTRGSGAHRHAEPPVAGASGL